MSQIQLIKVNLGNDCEVKTVNDQQVIEFSVAENRKYKDSKGEDRDFTQWYKCSYWTKSKIHEYLKKGTTVFVQGTLNASAFIDKAGSPKADLKVTVEKLWLLDSKPTDQDETSTDLTTDQNEQHD